MKGFAQGHTLVWSDSKTAVVKGGNASIDRTTANAFISWKIFHVPASSPYDVLKVQAITIQAQLIPRE